MILGLDISTNITGATVLDDSGKCIYNEFWDTRNKKYFPTQYHKAVSIRDHLIDIKYNFDINKIFVEEPFMFFNSGGSTAKTMSSLQRFNGMVTWMCFDIFQTTPEMISSMSARKALGIKVPRGEKAKKKSFDFVVANEPSFVVEYTRSGNPKPGIMDKSDSWVIAKAGYLTCLNKN